MKELKISSTEICESFKEGEKLVREVNKSIDMEVLLGKIKKIQQEVNELKNMIDGNKTILDKYPNELKKVSEKYKNTKMEIISLNLEEVFILIKDNLPIGVVGEIEGEDNKYLILKREEKRINNKKPKAESEIIGKVIRVISEENKFKVILNGENIKEYEEVFELDSLSRIYKIVTSININIAYKE